MNKPIPTLFLPKIVEALIENNRSGVYVLGDSDDGVFIPKYVGRSDTCLKKRLMTHNHLYEHPYLIYKYVESEKEAFYTEAKWWHDCKNQGLELDNRIHPDAPNGSMLVCPYCSFAKDAKNSLRY